MGKEANTRESGLGIDVVELILGFCETIVGDTLRVTDFGKGITIKI